MALFRKFFYRKPPDGLLEIAERVYVFDCCFTTDVVEDKNYESYFGGIAGQLRDHLPDSSFMVFNFREGDHQSRIANILSEYEMTVIDYPRQYEGCPVVTLEMIHHCLKSGDSWLLLGQRNVLLMHCERGGWPILAFMLAALFIYRKVYSGEQKTLDMIYRQAPRELLQLMFPINPIPSQLRYLQYVSRRNLDSEWPPPDRGLTLDCIMLRLIPDIDGAGGCRPILRIYGRDPSNTAERSPTVLFSTPKKSRVVRQYRQAESELVKIDVHCHVQGDVVLECISLDEDLEREQMMFRVMFSTAFIRSNILMLNRDEIDTLWDDKDKFPKNFRAEVLFSEMDSATSETIIDMPFMEEKEGLPIEAFAKVQEIFNSVDWIDSKPDVTLNVLHKISSSKKLKEKLEITSHQKNSSIESICELLEDNLKLQVLGDSIKSSPLGNLEKPTKPSSEAAVDTNLAGQKTDAHEELALNNVLDKFETATQTEESNDVALSSPQKLSEKEYLEAKEKLTASVSLVLEKISKQASEPSVDANEIPKMAQPEDLLPALHQATHTKIISPHILQSSRSSSVLYNNPLQVSPKPMRRFNSSPSSLGITALLHDHDTYKSDANAHLEASSPKPVPTSISFAPDVPISEQLSSSALPQPSSPLPPPPPPPPPLRSAYSESPFQQPSVNTSPLPLTYPSSTSASHPSQIPVSVPSSPPLQSGYSGSQFKHPSIVEKKSETPPTLHPSPSKFPPPSQSTSGSENDIALHVESTFPSGKNSLSSSVPPPPPPPPFPTQATSLIASSPSSIPPPKSLPLLVSSTVSNTSLPPPPPPPPPPPFAHPELLDAVSALSAPHPPPHLPPSFGQSPLNSRVSLSAPPPPPPPPPPFVSQSQSSNARSSLSIPPPPPPPPCLSENVSSATRSDLSNSSSCVVNAPPPPPPPPKSAVSASSTNLSSVVPPPPPPPKVTSTHGGATNLSKAPPMPPPPPIGASTQGGTTNSSKAPPVPPPPAPDGKGLPKANSSAQGSQLAGSNGPVPPPPGPFGLKGRVPPRVAPRNQGQSKKNNLKPYHWLKLTRVMQGSLWEEAQKPEEASKAPEFDMSELETLFAASVPNSEKGATGGQSRSRASGSKPDKVQLVELRRAYNCEIMLTKVKIPLPDLMNSVLALDDSALDADQVENLIKFCPTKEEMELLKGYKGDKENLGKCEQFFLELMKVPRVESKLRVFSFKIQFKTQVSDLRKNLQIVNSASEEIRSSVKLKRVMQTVLSLGNALNQGTARGAAVGFRLDSLLKLTDTRSRNSKMTLMHYLCKVLFEKLPEVLDFPKDLVNLEASTKIQLKILAEEMQAISKGLEKVVQELTDSGNDGSVSEDFCKILKVFLSYAEGEVRSLATLYSFVGRNADALANYFGEDPMKVPFEQVVSTLLNFVRMFLRAHDENCKQAEFEKKKAEKEAENEKSKLNARVKDSEQPVQSPRKIGTVK